MRRSARAGGAVGGRWLAMGAAEARPLDRARVVMRSQRALRATPSRR